MYPMYCPIKVNGISVLGYLDSGNSTETCISENFAKKVLKIKEEQINSSTLKHVGTAGKGTSLVVLGIAPKLGLQLGGVPKLFYVRPLIVRDLSMALNLSGPFMVKNKIDQIHSQNCIRVMGKSIPLVRSNSERYREYV